MLMLAMNWYVYILFNGEIKYQEWVQYGGQTACVERGEDLALSYRIQNPGVKVQYKCKAVIKD